MSTRNGFTEIVRICRDCSTQFAIAAGECRDRHPERQRIVRKQTHERAIEGRRGRPFADCGGHARPRAESGGVHVHARARHLDLNPTLRVACRLDRFERLP